MAKGTKPIASASILRRASVRKPSCPRTPGKVRKASGVGRSFLAWSLPDLSFQDLSWRHLTGSHKENQGRDRSPLREAGPRASVFGLTCSASCPFMASQRSKAGASCVSMLKPFRSSSRRRGSRLPTVAFKSGCPPSRARAEVGPENASGNAQNRMIALARRVFDNDRACRKVAREGGG